MQKNMLNDHILPGFSRRLSYINMTYLQLLSKIGITNDVGTPNIKNIS